MNGKTWDYEQRRWVPQLPDLQPSADDLSPRVVRAEMVATLRDLIDGRDDELGEALAPILRFLEEETVEDVIAQYQKRSWGVSTVAEGIALSDKFSEVCRRGEQIPAWALVVRALVARIHVLRANVERQDLPDNNDEV